MHNSFQLEYNVLYFFQSKCFFLIRMPVIDFFQSKCFFLIRMPVRDVCKRLQKCE